MVRRAGLRRSARAQSGFTLLEVMVAVAIFALIGVASGGVLSRVMQANEVSRQRAEQLAALQRGVTLLERDLLQHVPREVRDEYGDRRPALLLQAPGRLELTRQGWRNPLDLPRSDVQRVAWAMGPDGALERSYWRVLDRAQDTLPRTQKVLPRIDGFEVQLLDAAGTQWSYWPPTGDQTVTAPDPDQPAPVAVQLTLQLAPFGTLLRLIPLPDTAAVRALELAGGGAAGADNPDVTDPDASEEPVDAPQ